MEYISVAVVLKGWEICSLVLRGEDRVSKRGMEKSHNEESYVLFTKH
jgi:hypothetical protein